MRRLADSYGDRVLVGEIYLPIDKLVTYYGSDLSGVHLPFNFQLDRCAMEPTRTGPDHHPI
jgi:alpha-glucosidase